MAIANVLHVRVARLMSGHRKSRRERFAHAKSRVVMRKLANHVVNCVGDSSVRDVVKDITVGSRRD